MRRRNVRRTLTFHLQTRSGVMSNPKTEPTDNAKKDPMSGFRGMTP